MPSTSKKYVGRAVVPAVLTVLVLASVTAGCGDGGSRPELVESAEASTTETSAEPTTTERAASTTRSSQPADVADTDSDADVDDDGEEEATTTTAVPVEDPDDDEFAGEPLDFGPQLGTGLAIVGVAFDDQLNFRDGPSVEADVVLSIAPLSDDLDMAALGEAWAAPSGVWWKVNVVGQELWANQAYLGSLGAPVDRFDEVGSELGVLMFEDVEAAALGVAETRASEDPESRVVFVGEPLAFETGGFAVVDVLDLGDDSVKGERIRVEVDIVFDEESGEPGAQDVAFVVLTGVEIAPICGRGTLDGLCV